MKIKTKYPFQEYNGYTMINREDRKMIHLVHKETQKRTTISYARYLMSVKQNRILERWEQVDHINGNKKDDNIKNLQILSGKQNVIKHIIQKNKTRKMIELECPKCKIIFTREFRNSHIQKKGNFSCCSKKCLHEFLENGFPINELKKIGQLQVIRQFRMDASFYTNG